MGKFASGGIVTAPNTGVVGEAGPEAVIPLSRLRNVPPVAKAAGEGPHTVTMRVSVQPGVAVSRSCALCGNRPVVGRTRRDGCGAPLPGPPGKR